VPHIQLRGSAGHAEVDGALGLRCEIGQSPIRWNLVRLVGSCNRANQSISEKGGKSRAAQTSSHLAKELAPSFVADVFASQIRADFRVGARWEMARVQEFHLVSASSRFRSWLATNVHSANSSDGIVASTGLSPTARKVRAPSGSLLMRVSKALS